MAQELDIQSGVVIIKNKPYYFVEQVHGNNGDLIIAYDLSKISLAQYSQTHDPKVLAKAAIMKQVSYKKFQDNENSSTLSKDLAESLGDKNIKHRTTIFYKASIFTSPVTYGTDSVSGSYVKGFAEMKPTQITGPMNGHYPKMETTGIFIGLNNVKWLKDVYDFKRFKGYDYPIYDRYSLYFQAMSSIGAYAR